MIIKKRDFIFYLLPLVLIQPVLGLDMYKSNPPLPPGIITYYSLLKNKKHVDSFESLRRKIIHNDFNEFKFELNEDLKSKNLTIDDISSHFRAYLESEQLISLPSAQKVQKIEKIKNESLLNFSLEMFSFVLRKFEKKDILNIYHLKKKTFLFRTYQLIEGFMEKEKERLRTELDTIQEEYHEKAQVAANEQAGLFQGVIRRIQKLWQTA